MSRNEGPTHTSAPPKLPATLHLGAVHLSVSDLERSVEFYEDAIGLRLHHREDGVAAMGVGEEDLLLLYEERGARRAGPLAATITISASTSGVERACRRSRQAG